MIRRIWSLNPISNLNEISLSLSLSLSVFQQIGEEKEKEKKRKNLTFLNPTEENKQNHIASFFLFVLF